MGFLWDLIQQSQLSSQREKSASLEQRIDRLEHELDETKRLLRLTLERLEKQLGEDLDRDGQIG